MLVLSRKVGEAIRLGDQVAITVVQLGRGRVRLAIEAPRDVSVHRAELYARLKEAAKEQLAECSG